jgi:hypothetical protein
VLKKLFGGSDAELNQALAELAADLPETRWLVLLDPSGIAKASFPADMQIDRPSAMGAALLSLGERIVHELAGGEFRYVLLSGSLGVTLAVTLTKDALLLLNLRPGVSADAVLAALGRLVGPLAHRLGGETPGWLLPK